MQKRCFPTGSMGVKGMVLAAALVAGAGLTGGWATPARAEAARASAQDTQAAAKAVVDRAIKVLAESTGYSDSSKMTIKFRAKNAKGEAQNMDDTKLTSLAMAKGQKLAFTSDEVRVVSDGTTLTVLDVGEKRYVQKPLADKPDLGQMLGFHGEALTMHPLAPSATSAELGAVKSLGFLTEVTSVADEQLDGRPGKRVTGKGPLPGLPAEITAKVGVWFADDTGLPGQVVADGTEPVRKMMNDMLAQAPPELAGEMKMTVEEVSLTWTLTGVKLNEAPAADAFAFKPDADAKKVDSLMPDMGGGDHEEAPSPLLGKPAPEITGKLTDGTAFKLSDLKGKVVVLDFWAMWCPPCRAALPHIQKLHEEFKDKGVVFVGMNNDGPDDGEKLKKFLEKEGVTFAQFPPNDKVNEAFKIEGFPTMIIIGKDGTVQDVAVGFGGPAEVAKKKEKLEKLLKGESLAKPAEKGDKPADAPAAKPAGDGMGG